jgi:hypothetical protein
VPSQRVAEKIGLAYERDASSGSGEPIRIYATPLSRATGGVSEPPSGIKPAR